MFVHPPPPLSEILAGSDTESILRSMMRFGAAPAPYAHWDKLRHLPPPDDLDHRAWWAAIKLSRASQLRELPLEDPTGIPFKFAIPDEVERLLHFVDQHCAGGIEAPEPVSSVLKTDDQGRRRYLVNSLMEEAIRSSQLEGATTSRRAAKDMLKSGRAPRNRSERMILNNYRALQFMREELGDRLTPAGVLELHRVLTEGTLDDPSAAGRLQTPDEDRVAVFDRVDGSLVHTPPPANQLPDRLERLCAFANQDLDSDRFVHPVVRAIILHFWLAYDHPFEDGNGRTARALFYWSMRQQRYWLTEYLAISKILRKAPVAYSRAFVYTETDDGDTTYFLLYQLEVIKRAVEELHGYLARQARQIQETERRARASGALNQRQLALVGHALRNEGAEYTFRSHAVSHGVTHETARKDLTELNQRGLVVRQKRGREFAFVPAPDLAVQLTGEPLPSGR